MSENSFIFEFYKKAYKNLYIEKLCINVWRSPQRCGGGGLKQFKILSAHV